MCAMCYCMLCAAQGISTSDLLLRILSDADAYRLRNLARGTRQQLGISYFKVRCSQCHGLVR